MWNVICNEKDKKLILFTKAKLIGSCNCTDYSGILFRFFTLQVSEINLFPYSNNYYNKNNGIGPGGEAVMMHATTTLIYIV